MPGYEKGFSILEVLIGVTIFTFGMLGVAALQTSTIKANGFSGNLTKATILAGSKMEELLAVPYAGLDNNTDTLGAYSRTWIVTDNATSQWKSINITVQWTRKDKNYSVTINGFRSAKVI